MVGPEQLHSAALLGRIDVRGVSFWYPDGTRALSAVDLVLAARRINVVFGPARAGKSSLLRLLNRLQDLVPGARHTGDVLLNGVGIFGPEVDVSDLRRRVSMVFAVPTPLPGSIRANLTYGLRMAGHRDTAFLEDRVEWSLQQAALWDEVKDRLDSSAYALSGGQRQRLCLARSLALGPEVILLDNPTSGLDPLSTALVENALQVLKDQVTIVMVPHSTQQAARLADRAAFFLDGELVEAGAGAEIFLGPTDKRTEDYVTGRFG
ncbi:MAG TPA: phosphate ABC transporter ATP-binding protein [Anaerolineae bacterium]|nr:phosphate ABC transporter ATP-binding protein [Ardenticatenia bacterium]HQZ71393.1 phosphate ABC transporter ATP-binding protein [Anaerolineae bacterium]HRA20456.1 phosphate ABC transporter ATP-binding protein [Anaerolineae bacterium]